MHFIGFIMRLLIFRSKKGLSVLICTQGKWLYEWNKAFRYNIVGGNEHKNIKSGVVRCFIDFDVCQVIKMSRDSRKIAQIKFQIIKYNF